jgi:hypothetical protein
VQEIKITREACCAADDQTMPLELILRVSDGETLRSVLERVIGADFLQFSSTYTCASGFVGDKPVARVLANFNAHPVTEFDKSPDALASAMIPGGLLEFRWSGSNNSFNPNPLRGSA